MRLNAAPLALCAFAALVTLGGAGCTGRGRAPLPDGPALGDYANAGDPESYNTATLYGYMDGGADAFLEYGFSQLWVRRYTRGSTQLVVELYTMRDAAAAQALYSSMRRPNKEVDLAAGCRGDVDDSGVRVARGDRYLACRNENPLAQGNDAARDLCARLVTHLAGDCGVGSLFASLPSDGRVAGSEVALAGPLGLNQRVWLASLGREGFERGSVASYTFPGGRAEVLLASYKTAEAARVALGLLQKDPRPGMSSLARERRLVLAYSEDAAKEPLSALVARLAQSQ
jgi:hypothetical protein